MQDIVLIGGGGHAKSVIDIIECENKFNIIGIIDTAENIGKNVLGYKIIGTDENLKEIFQNCKNAHISIGQIKTNEPRKRIFEILKNIGFNLPVIISPFAYVSKHATIGEGSIIMHNALINSGAVVGKNCIINTKALIEHDAKIGNHCHISTASVINGGVIIADDTFFGSNATSKEYINIGENCVVGGGCSDNVKFSQKFESKKRVKIGYFADGIWSHNAFEKIINDKDIEICFICVRFNATDKTLQNLAIKHKIDCFSHKNINSNEFINLIKKYSCDLFVSMSFDQIFKEEIINLVPYKIINCHAGKLPFYRGRNILNWALINDEKEFGITVHYVDSSIDTGDIILQRTYEITDNDTYKTLLEKAYIECAKILYDAINLFKFGIVKGKKQGENGFYCTQRKLGDEILDFNQTSREIFNFVRAICTPGPMARAYINGKEMKINRVEMIQNATNYRCVNGAILKKEKEGFLVKTQDNFVKIAEYEFNGEFRVGDRFENKGFLK